MGYHIVKTLTKLFFIYSDSQLKNLRTLCITEISVWVILLGIIYAADATCSSLTSILLLNSDQFSNPVLIFGLVPSMLEPAVSSYSLVAMASIRIFLSFS